MHRYCHYKQHFASLLYKPNRFHVANCRYSNRSQMISKFGWIIRDTLGCFSCPFLLSLLHFDIICDLLLNRCIATWNLFVNPLQPNISMHILHTVLHTFSKRLTRRICLTIKSCLNSWWSSPVFSWLSCVIQEWYSKEKLDANHSNLGFKGLRWYQSLHEELKFFFTYTHKCYFIYFDPKASFLELPFS